MKPHLRRAALAAVPVIALAAAAVVLLLTVFRPAPSRETDLAPLLASLDASIRGGYLTTASDAISGLRDLPREQADQARLLKRAWQVSAGTGDYSVLANLAARLPGRADSRRKAVEAYADLRSGRVADALRIVGSPKAAGEEGEALRGEALLRSGGRWQGSGDLTRGVLSLEGSVDAAAFVQAALRADDTRLALDGALLAMQAGNPQAAAVIVRSQLGETRFDEAAGIILYDAGAFDEALTRLRQRLQQSPATPGVGFLLADVAQAAGKAAAAEALVLQALRAAPALSWTPYADLAYWSLGRGDTQGALRRLDDGLAFFPQSRELRVTKSRVLIRARDGAAAEPVLQGLVNERPSDVESALLLLSVQGASLSPEAGRGRLWKIFGQAPADPVVFDTLCAALVAARDWEGMKIAVARHSEAGGQPDARALTLMGFAAAMTGDTEGALSTLRKADQAQRDGIARADLAIVMIQKGSTRAARTELDAAEDEVRATAPAASVGTLVSRIETLRAASYLLEGNGQGAASALARARALDPSNLRAALMAAKLAGGNQ